MTHAGLALERAVERLDLAHRAASLDVGLPQVVAMDLGTRRDDAKVDVEPVLHLLDQPPRLGEQVLGVEQDDVGCWDRR